MPERTITRYQHACVRSNLQSSGILSRTEKVAQVDLVRQRFLQTAFDNTPASGFRNNMGLISKFKGSLLGKSKEKSGGLDGGGVASSSSATSDPTSSSTTAATTTGPAEIASITTTIMVPPAEQCLSPPASITPVLSSAQAATSEIVSPPPNNNINPWTRSYQIVQKREPELIEDYEKHLNSLQDDSSTSVDLSNQQSIPAAMEHMLQDREKKQWRVSLFGKDVKIRSQTEKLVKFLIWSDPIVKNAVNAQPYAALAWSGVSLLLPVSN